MDSTSWGLRRPTAGKVPGRYVRKCGECGGRRVEQYDARHDAIVVHLTDESVDDRGRSHPWDYCDRCRKKAGLRPQNPVRRRIDRAMTMEDFS